ncbi:MAG: hypothetical protein M0R37_12725 [Bacteroidales bacterium]|nr:hypothetical protein [Bacteroidales bacterium]
MAQKQARIKVGNTVDQRLLIDIRNAIEDLTTALGISGDKLSLTKQIRELNDRLDKSDQVANVLLALHTEEELEAARASLGDD